MLTRIRRRSQRWVSETYEKVHNGVIRLAESKKMRIFGIVFTGTSFASAVNYCVGLLGSGEILADVNFALTALGFVLAGALGYVGFDLGISGLRKMKKEFVKIWEILGKFQENQNLLEKNQILEDEGLKKQLEINRLMLGVIKELSSEHSSVQVQITQIESLLRSLEEKQKNEGRTAIILPRPPSEETKKQRSGTDKGAIELKPWIDRKASQSDSSTSGGSPSVFFSRTPTTVCPTPTRVHPLMPELELDCEEEEEVSRVSVVTLQ